MFSGRNAMTLPCEIELSCIHGKEKQQRQQRTDILISTEERYGWVEGCTGMGMGAGRERSTVHWDLMRTGVSIEERIIVHAFYQEWNFLLFCRRMLCVWSGLTAGHWTQTLCVLCRLLVISRCWVGGWLVAIIGWWWWWCGSELSGINRHAETTWWK